MWLYPTLFCGNCLTWLSGDGFTRRNDRGINQEPSSYSPVYDICCYGSQEANHSEAELVSAGECQTADHWNQGHLDPKARPLPKHDAGHQHSEERGRALDRLRERYSNVLQADQAQYYSGKPRWMNVKA